MRLFNLIEIKWLGTQRQQIDKEIERLLIEEDFLKAIKYYRADVHNRKIGLKEAKRHVDKIHLRLVYGGKIPSDGLTEHDEKILLDEGITHVGKYKVGYRTAK